METCLQSNEIRIPKPEFDLKTSFNSDHLNTSGGGGSNQHSPQQHFKSSFARSLSTFGSSPQSKSLDFSVNYPGYSRLLPTRSTVDEDEGTLMYSTFVDNSPLSMPPMFSPELDDDDVDEGAARMGQGKQRPATEQSTESLVSSSSVATTIRRNVWTDNAQKPTATTAAAVNNGTHKMQVNHHQPHEGSNTQRKLHQSNKSSSICSDSAEIEVLRLRKECQNLIEENRRLLNLAGVDFNGASNGGSNVEAVILQNHVDTLQWQLKQVESSRQMYRALMEEVVRFLERCHHGLDTLLLEEPIARSKSSHHVHQDPDSSHLSNCSDNDQSVIASPSPTPANSGFFATSRLRCSTIDAPKLFNRNLSTSGVNSTMQTAGSYTNFRDFTWRRNRKQLNRTQSTVEMDPEKLSQEAFRLLRTANNLLNTHEPSLAMPKSIFDSNYSSPTPSPHLMNQSLNSSFCRKSNGRQSNSSMRSCCDTNSTSSNSSGASSGSSAQKAASTSSDREDLLLEGMKSDKAGSGVRHSHAAAAAAAMMMHSEAESGFSSISSFQEIGLPLVNSTVIGHGTSSVRSNGTCSSSNASNNSDDAEGDLTIQAGAKEEVPPMLPKRAPVHQQYSHRRWDSAPALPPKKSTTLHAFHAPGKGEESLRVLWV